MNNKLKYIGILLSLFCSTLATAQGGSYEAEEFVNDSDLQFAVKEMQKSEFIGTQIACEKETTEICDSAANSLFEQYKGKVKIPIEAFTGLQHYTMDSTALFGVSNLQINRLLIDCQSGANVSSIADGEVTAIFSIPGNETVVLIKHGSYRSVYGSITEVTVAVGDLVDRGQSIGVVSDIEDGKMVFEIWKSAYGINTALPVESWIELN